jgi:hypothetical protein
MCACRQCDMLEVRLGLKELGHIKNKIKSAAWTRPRPRQCYDGRVPHAVPFYIRHHFHSSARRLLVLAECSTVLDDLRVRVAKYTLSLFEYTLLSQHGEADQDQHALKTAEELLCSATNATSMPLGRTVAGATENKYRFAVTSEFTKNIAAFFYQLMDRIEDLVAVDKTCRTLCQFRNLKRKALSSACLLLAKRMAYCLLFITRPSLVP